VATPATAPVAMAIFLTTLLSFLSPQYHKPAAKAIIINNAINLTFLFPLIFFIIFLLY
jgi:hypothetical protein